MKIQQAQTNKAYQCVFPFYSEDKICPNLSKLLSYPLDEIVKRKSGDVTRVYTLGRLNSEDHIQAEELIFLCLGERNKTKPENIKKHFGSLYAALEKDVIILVERMVADNIDAEKAVRLVTESLLYAEYAYPKKAYQQPKDLQVFLKAKDDITKVIDKAVIYGNAINNARRLGDIPSNLLTPSDLARYAMNLASRLGLEITVLDKEALRVKKMGALLGVNAGSANEAKLIIIKYHAAGDAPWTALVGKGLTFDSGGYNLKPSQSMAGMKYDMCGGANVLAAIEIIASLKLKANVMAVVPATENLISGSAYKAGDVLTSLSGKTIEITNTDAEGRLILCDALTYAQQLGAKRIIDIATLTGACSVALGKEFTGVFANSEAFLNEFKAVAEGEAEPIWQLPLSEGFTKQLQKSKVADLVNAVVGAGGGASLAASFLKEFIEPDVEWIHLDIAATSTNDDGATGVMVASMARLFEK
jgi:leucyl aminopeptidase